MSNQQDKKPDEDQQPREQPLPDKRGPRPTDPNALAKWIVEQATDEDSEASDDESATSSNHRRSSAKDSS